tara:strand:+ start:73 stop:654 length:582 start_codon:yes stop_codon:yes gene_type:complete
MNSLLFWYTLNMEELSKKFKQTKNILETNNFEFNQLRNFYKNISKSLEISENEKEKLIDIIKNLIHTNFPKKAKNIFGKKSEQAIILLEEVFNQLKEEFDWSKNKIGSRVKVGGDMINGSQHVVYYISYKNEKSINTGFIYRQFNPTEDPFIEVYKRQLGKVKEIDDETKKFSLEQKDQAVDLYKSYLKSIIN